MIGQFYEVEKIIGRRKIKNKYEYLIKWKDYSIEESTWEPEDKLFTIKYLIEEYDNLCDEKEKKKKNSNKKKNNEKLIEKNKALSLEVVSDINSDKNPYFLIDDSLDKILAIKLEKNELVGIVERRDKEGKVYTEKISTEDIKKINPWILVDFYESKISFE